MTNDQLLRLTPARRRTALCTSLSPLALAVAGMALAQAPETPGEQPALEEILVTGTNIRGQDYSAPVPADVVTQDDLAASGFATTADLISRLPANTGSEANAFGFAQNNTLGTAQVNLRGLGLGATLTLLNNRRMATNASFADDGSTFVDINTIPVALIERVEVVKSGSSSIYGSDAVAGVVNFITRSDFEGFELQGNFQTSDQGSQDDLTLSGIAGWGNDTTHMSVAATYFDRSNLTFADRDFIPLDTELENIGKPGSFILLAPPQNPAFAGLPLRAPIPDPNCAAAGGVAAGPVGFCLTDSRPFQELVSEEERVSVYADLRHNINDSTSLFVELLYADNEAVRGVLPSFPGLAAQIVVPPNNPHNPFGAPAVFVGRPLGPDVDLGSSAFESETARITFGGSHDFDEVWRADVSYVYAQNDFTAQFNDTNAANLAAALRGQGPGGEFLNVFGTAVLDPALAPSAEVVDFVSVQPEVEYESDTHVLELGLSGALFELPGGQLGVAGGFQYRRNSAGFDASEELNAPRGTISFLPPIADFPSESLDVYAAYIEFGAPIHENVDLQLALRYEDYGGEIGDTLDPKAAIRWDVTDALTLRGSAGTSFRAPTPLQLGGSTTQVTPIINPCTGQRSAAAVVTDGNPDLTPEDSTSFGAGIAFEGESGLRASLDYYHYDYEDIITRNNPQAVAAAASCEMLAPGVVAPISDDIIINPASGQIVQVNADFFNAGSIETDGFDVNLGYLFNLGDSTTLDIDVTATKILSYDVQELPGGPVIDGADSRNRLNFARSAPDMRANASFQLASGSHLGTAIVRYIGGYADDLNDNAAIDSQLTLDLQYSYTFRDGLGGFGKGTSLALGAINVTGEDPPFVDDRAAYDPIVHDPRGRLVYLRIQQTF